MKKRPRKESAPQHCSGHAPLLLCVFILNLLVIESQAGCFNTNADCSEGCWHEGSTTSCGFGCTARVCIPAGKGYYSPFADNDRYPCPKGTYSEIWEAETCTPCPSGSYQDAIGQSSCIQCPSSTYNELSGREEMSDCLPCSPGYAGEGARAFYYLDETESQKMCLQSWESWTPMPTALPSLRPSSAPSTPMPTALPSHRPSSAPSSKPSDLPTTSPSITPSVDPSFAPSARPSSMPWTNSPSSNMPMHEASSAPSSEPSATSSERSTYQNFGHCPLGYTGEDCDECCDASHKKYVGSNEVEVEIGNEACDAQQLHFGKQGGCLPCPSLATSLLVGFFGMSSLLICVLVAYGYVHTQSATTTPAMLYIGIDYLQGLSLVGSIKIPWSKALRGVFSAASVFSFDLDAISPLDCASKVRYEGKLALILCLPLIIGACVVLAAWAVARYNGGLDNHGRFNTTIGIGMTVMYFAYLQLSTTAAEALGSGHGPLITVGVFGFFLYAIVFPLTLAIKLKRPDGNKSIQAEDFKNDCCAIHQQRYGLLYCVYRPQYWFWSIALLARRLLAVCAGAIWKGNGMTHTSVLVLIFVASGMLHHWYEPYNELSTEMMSATAASGKDGKDDESGEDDSMMKYPLQVGALAKRRNVDSILHGSLFVTAIFGATLSGVVNNENAFMYNALSFLALTTMAASICFLGWAIYSEVAAAIQFIPAKASVGISRRESSPLLSLPQMSAESTGGAKGKGESRISNEVQTPKEVISGPCIMSNGHDPRDAGEAGQIVPGLVLGKFRIDEVKMKFEDFDSISLSGDEEEDKR